MGNLSKNFSKEEFACKHCGQFKADPLLINKLQLFRDNIGKPVGIISGYRCPVYNKSLPGAAKNSFHVKGTAADIVISGATYGDLIWLAKQLGFNGIGIYPDQGFIHVDVGNRKAYWVKYSGKAYQYMTYEQLTGRKEIHEKLK